jgi:hypothetical protein
VTRASAMLYTVVACVQSTIFRMKKRKRPKAHIDVLIDAHVWMARQRKKRRAKAVQPKGRHDSLCTMPDGAVDSPLKRD